ncbi:Signal transduction histidine kinase [Candidatus Terasakiella magnetica]|nr:Signal transduction histidine kinase [Candidatus Terasakiella magnetica]
MPSGADATFSPIEKLHLGQVANPINIPFMTRFAVTAFIALILLALSIPSSTAAERMIVLSGQTGHVNLAGTMDVLRDPSGTLTPERMSAPEVAAAFRPLPGILLGGYDQAPHWLRFRLKRESQAGTDWLLDVTMPYLDHVDLYAPDGNGGFSVVKTGDRTPFSTRPLKNRDFVFKIAVPPEGETTLYLRVQTSSSLTVRADVWSLDGFTEHAASEALVFGLLHGLVVVIIIFSLTQYVVLRDRIYIVYTAYIVSAEVMYAALNGYIAQYALPETPMLADALVGISAGAAICTGIIFGTQILSLKRHYPRINRVLQLYAVLAAMAGLSSLADLYSQAAPWMYIGLIGAMTVSLSCAATRALKGDRVAWSYLAAFSVFIATTLLVLVRILGIISAPDWIDLASQAALAPHMILLSLGLAQRMAGIEAGRKELQAAMLRSAKQVERQLEERVGRRTRELAAVNATLAAEIGERRTAEERVRESETMVRAILDAAPFPMLVSNFSDGHIMFANPPAAKLIGLSPEAIIGRRTAEFYANPDERAEILGQIQDRGAIIERELRIRGADGGEHWVMISAVRFRYGKADAVQICLSDISVHKELEESKRQASRHAEDAMEAERRAIREQRNFLSMVSHEFRMPLAIIEAASHLLGIYTHDDSEAEDEVAKIQRAVRRLSDLIDICLADDRLDSSLTSLRIESIDLGKVLDELCEDKRTFAVGRALAVESTDRPILQADSTLLRVAFSNLIDNALKFSPPGSAVSVRMLCDGEAVMVSVTDQGPGITLEEQGQIFEKFFRSTKANRIRGAGLGLYIVKRIIDLHGGGIAVDSLPGHGATFIVWLPLDASMIDNHP